MFQLGRGWEVLTLRETVFPMIDRGGDRWEVRPVGQMEAPVALAILQEAAIWSATIGAPVWSPDEFTLADQLRVAAAGELIGGFDEMGMAACMRLQATDRLFWPDDPEGEALYVHKIAVARRAVGRDWLSRLIHHAIEQARERGAFALRLDTLPRPRMLELYTDRGFEAVDAEPRRFGDRFMIRLELRI